MIIPVYNVEKYLRSCLDSIANQSCKDFECICIDDGSTDGSTEILQEFAERDCRFTIVRTENRGVSSARNEGIRRARGEYISFLDSDDFVHPQYLEIMLNDLQNTGLEVTSCCFAEVPEKASYESFDFNRINCSPLQMHKSFIQALLQNDKTIKVVVWNKLYRADLVRKCLFNEGLRAHEDNVFTLQVASCTGSIGNNSAQLLYHRDTPKSLSKHKKTEWRKKFIDSWLGSVHDLDHLTSEEKRLLRRRTMRLLYREVVKRPLRAAATDHVEILKESRNTLLANKRNGLFMEQYLPIQDQVVCRLLLAGFCSIVKHLHCSPIFNWKLYMKKAAISQIPR